ncbi:MAG: ParB/RepB/Spo0J family partition protein [Chloroflexi bacterium]|nr:MAG: ParB/RepB/Spo0J family partition protein [Chloroflexota bacterium]
MSNVGLSGIELVARLEATTSPPAGVDTLFKLVPVELIDAAADQPRQSFNHAALDELTQSVWDHGILQPLRLRPRGRRYQLVAGQRRLTAATRAGLKVVPAVIAELEDDQALAQALIENIQREDLNAVDRCEALRRLRVNLGAQSWEEVGRVLGISRRHVYHLLSISALPEPIQEDMRRGNLTEKHGRALLRLRRDEELQDDLWRRIREERLSGDEALQAATELGPGRGQAAVESPRSAAAVAPPRVGRGAQADLPGAVDALLRRLPHATMREIRPLKKQLEALAERLAEVLTDAFYEDDPRAE